ncbi:hypothetical protein SPFM1_00170 [Salmonella phage SPFM1]|nr:hypothetical protein SPFM1_00170 [Salmonella phage SPFM1]
MNKLSLWMNNLDAPATSMATQYAMALSELRNNPSPETADARFEALPVSRGAFYGSQILLRMQEAILSTVKELNQANNLSKVYHIAVLRQATDLEGDGETSEIYVSIRAYVMY